MKDNKQLRLGLGEAISRLLKIEILRQNRLYEMSDAVIKEKELIINALDELRIELAFDCDGDGVPDTVEIFEKSVKDDCCKLIKSDDTKPKRAKRSVKRKK